MIGHVVGVVFSQLVVAVVAIGTLLYAALFVAWVFRPFFDITTGGDT